MRRLIESACALVLLVVGSPLFLIIAAAILFTSGQPVFFGHIRVGLHGEEFRLFKFRSMINHAAKSGGWATSTNDVRITGVGRILRSTSVDELPQLWNVLTGSMSFIGPRPDVPEQRSLYTDEEWEIRHSVRPGITGLAQATLRSDATPEQRKSLDLEYVRNNSFAMNLKIIALTIRRVASQQGAN